MDLALLRNQHIGYPINLMRVVLTRQLLGIFHFLLQFLYFLLILLINAQQFVLLRPELIDVVFELVDNLFLPLLGHLDSLTDLVESPLSQLLQLFDFIFVAPDEFGVWLIGTARDVRDLFADSAGVDVQENGLGGGGWDRDAVGYYRVLLLLGWLGFTEALLDFGQRLLLLAHILPLLEQIVLLPANLFLLFADLLLLFADGLLLFSGCLLLLQEELAFFPQFLPLSHQLFPFGRSMFSLRTLVDSVEALLEGQVGAVVLDQGQPVQGLGLGHVGRHDCRPLDVIAPPQSADLFRLRHMRLLPLVRLEVLVLHHDLLRHGRGQAHIGRIDLLREFHPGIELLRPWGLPDSIVLHCHSTRTGQHIHLYLKQLPILEVIHQLMAASLYYGSYLPLQTIAHTLIIYLNQSAFYQIVSMEDNREGSREYYEDRIDKFDEFKKHGMPLHKDSFEDQKNKYKEAKDKKQYLLGFEQFAKPILEKLAKNKERHYILFFEWLPDDFRNIFVKLVETHYPEWTWEYEHLFLGSKKQLIVYKNYRPIVRYLEKYRLPNTFEPKKVAMQSLMEDISEVKRERNQLWSNDEDIEEISKKIQKLEEKIQEAKKQFFQLLVLLFDDFNAQEKRTQMSLRGLRSEIQRDIADLVQKTGLFYRKREITKLFWQAEIQKQKFQEEELKQEEEEVEQQKVERRREPREPRQPRQSKEKIKPRQQGRDQTKLDSDDDQQVSQPNKIKEYDIVDIAYGSVDVRFRIPFNNLSPITKFIGYSVDSDGSLIFNTQQPYKEVKEDIYEKMTLKGEGFCKFAIKAENQIGIAQEYDTFCCFIQNQKEKKVMMIGSAVDGVMGYVDNTVDYREEQLPVPASRLSMRQTVMALDTRGTLAMWGNIYVQEEEEDGVKLVDNELLEEQPICRIEPPYKIDDVKFVTKVSCGQYFYLLCDALGKAWSFGSNRKHCLGFADTNKHTSTYDPKEIAYFRKKNVFVIDVAAGVQHALALDCKGKAYSWGMYQGELKDFPVKDSFGSTINYSVGKEKFALNQPRQIMYKGLLLRNQKLNIGKIIIIRAGLNFSAIVTEDGQLQMWGKNDVGQLGCGKLISEHKQIKHILIPIVNQTLKNLNLKITQLEVGSSHCLAVAEDENNKRFLYSWGVSYANECGHQSKTVIWEPKEVDFFKGHLVKSISAGASGSVVLTDKGLFAFGMKNFLSKSAESSINTSIRQLKFEWEPKIKDIRLSENTAAFLVDY